MLIAPQASQRGQVKTPSASTSTASQTMQSARSSFPVTSSRSNMQGALERMRAAEGRGSTAPQSQPRIPGTGENINVGGYGGTNQLPNTMPRTAPTVPTAPEFGKMFPRQPNPWTRNKGPMAPGGTDGSSTMSDIDKFYQDLLGADAADWEKKQGLLREDMGAFGREADIMNARMGGGVMGGGYASLAGAALGKGMRAFSEAELAHNDRRRELQLAWLDKQLAERQRQEDRRWEMEDQDKADELAMLQMLMGMEGFEMTPEMFDRYFGGLGAEYGDVPNSQGNTPQEQRDFYDKVSEMVERLKRGYY